MAKKERFIKDMELGLAESEVETVIGKFITDNGFYRTNWKGEDCFTWDHMAIKELRFFMYSYHEGILHIEAWLRNGKSGEMGLTGFVASDLKVPYFALINQLFARLTALLPEDSPLRQTAQNDLDAGNKKLKTGTIVLAVALLFGLILVWEAFF